MKVYVPCMKAYDKKLHFYNDPNKEAKIIVCSTEQKAIEFLWKQVLRQKNKISKEEKPTLELVNSISYFPCCVDEIDIDFIGNSM
jgi:Fe2+ or Zn2+ uptake regulation protein